MLSRLVLQVWYVSLILLAHGRVLTCEQENSCWELCDTLLV